MIRLYWKQFGWPQAAVVRDMRTAKRRKKQLVASKLATEIEVLRLTRMVWRLG